ncbi:hypothetical protein 2203_scaffold802_00036 [Bacteriophage sp.]|nr:hypothetical protein 2203_scaffold802_00036 [Bacteriophage sp.]
MVFREGKSTAFAPSMTASQPFLSYIYGKRSVPSKIRGKASTS